MDYHPRPRDFSPYKLEGSSTTSPPTLSKEKAVRERGWELYCDLPKLLSSKLQQQVAATNHSVCTGSNTLRRDKSLQYCVLENYCENLVSYDCNRILRRNKSHKFCLIWFLATCCCDQILSQRRRFWQKYPNTHEAICRCDVSPRHVTSTCRLVRTDLNCRGYLSRKKKYWLSAFRYWTP